MTDETKIQKDAAMPKVDPNINFFAMTDYRNQYRRFGIKLDDRRRHMYVIGKTGMGKTTLLENMILSDIYAGHGVGVVDPHGDSAEKIIDFIPPNRINDVVYFNPADIDYPIGFNILEILRPEQKHLVASGLMGVFKKIWPDVWSSRMEYILNNTILALLDFPGTTLLGINRLLADDEYRRRVTQSLKDPVVKAFWNTEFAAYSEKYKKEAVAPIQNKIGQFLSASIIRNIVAQVRSRIDIRDIMDNKKIFIMNLSKGRIGEDNSRLLGGMLITKIQLAAMERVDIPEEKRNDFFLYVDEFQNFATESFANILSEARKYRLDLTMAHQYMEQLEEEVLAAVIGNVGTIVTYRVGSTDAEILAKEFIPTFEEQDLVNLPKYQIYLKLMIDGVASRPFSAVTLPPIGSATGSRDKVVRVSRERYAVQRDKIEDKIARWSGMAIGEGENVEEDWEKIDGEEASAPIAPTKKEASLIPPAAHTPLPPSQGGINKPAKVLPTAPGSEPAKISPPAPKSEPVKFYPLAPPPVRAVTPTIVAPRPQLPPRPQQNVSMSERLRGGGGQPAGGLGPPGQNRRKKKKRSGGFNPSAGGAVMLVDPGQKGISLNTLRQSAPPSSTPQSPPQSRPAPRPPAVQAPVERAEERAPSEAPIAAVAPRVIRPGQVEELN